MDLESARFQEAKEKANHPTVTIWLLVALALNVAMLVVGFVKKDECPVEDKIPIFLIVAGAVGILSKVLPLVNRKLDWCLIHLAIGLLFLFEFIWIIIGSVWVYGTKVSYEFGPNYCSKSAYLMSFWLLTIYWVLWALCIFIGCCCCCCFRKNNN